MATNTSNASATAYKNTYTTFSGCDIVASFGATIIGELQGISYSVTREKAPVSQKAAVGRSKILLKSVNFNHKDYQRRG